MSLLFLAKTSQNDIFEPAQTERCFDKGIQSLRLSSNKTGDVKTVQEIERMLPEKIATEFQTHRIIRLSFSSKLKLFFLNFCSFCFNAKHHKLKRLYNKGERHIERQMDITHMLQNIKDAKIFLKEKFLNKAELFGIEHNKHNLIHLDTSTSGFSSTSFELND